MPKVLYHKVMEWFKKHEVFSFILISVIVVIVLFIIGQLIPTLGETLDSLVVIVSVVGVIGALAFVFLGKYF